MKTKVKRMSKRTLAVFLGVVMLISCLVVGEVTANAWNNTTWYLGNDIAKVWDNSASNCTMTKSGSVKFYYDLYLKTTDADVYYRPYEKNNYAMGPTAGNNTKVTTTGTAGSGYNDGRCWYFDTADCTASKYNKIRIWIDTSGNNGNGWSWYEKTAINNISPTLTVPSNGTVGTAITLTGGSTDSNKIGALTKTYQYSTNNGSTWTDLASGSYTATSAGTVKFRYKVSDAGVKTSGSGTNGRTARVEYSSEQSCTFSAAATTYNNIAVAAKGSTDGSTFNTTLSGTPATISANSYTTGSSALTINAGTVLGYTFYNWKVTSGSGTIGSATTANTTFTPSASNTTVTAQYKKNYTISKNTPTGGSVALSKTSAVAGETYTVTLTPNDGYKVKSLTLNGSAVTVSNNKYTGTASGTADTLAFVATFEPITNLQLYIAGRFRVRSSSGSSSWTTTYASGSDWNAASENIPFTYLSGTTYKVDTYASLAELSAKIGSSSYTGDPVFFVYDKTNSKNWYASSATTMSTSGTTLVSSGGANSNLKFSSTSTDSPVTIYYDSNTHKIWYTIPNFYNVTVGTATGGSVTASPSRAEAGTNITLTISPSTGYELSSITAKDSSNATVSLSGTGNTRTFTMPAKNVTVTPVFSKKSFSGLTAVGKYSTTGASNSYTNTWTTGGPNVTIAATNATQLDGVAVSAPATDPTGYVFAGWYTTTGSFSNAANKDTTFYPNAANAQAVATYKKIFTITSSVDNTGTGAGTVTTSKTSVEAGGSYTITATAKSGSAVESVKVNGTAKTATASQTINSVSADQNVVVKFKSNVYLKGTMNATAWAGDVMQANTAGTSYTKSEVVLNAGTTYEFKHWVDSGGNGTYSTTVGTWTLNNIATHSTKSDGYSGTNLTITPSVKAKVTFVSDGTKFTSITAIPFAGDDEEVTYVDIYAKNGMLRDSTFNRFTNLAKTKVTKVVYPDGTIVNEGGAIEAYGSKTMTWNNNVTGYSSNYVKMTNVPVGSTITLETELSPGGETYTGTKKFSDTHYLKAYSMNGKSYKLHTASEGTATTNGVKYTEDWVVESINTDHMGAENNGHVVEINPIYYLKDNTNTKTFYIEGYEGELQENWGTTLAVYPYYEGKSNAANAFGGYPGQPMLFYGGKYQMEIPLTVDGTSTGAQVKGLTLHNAYWDLLHRSLDKKCDDNHRQTYDYDDFYKLYKEKTTDSIIFWFKYRTQNDNYGDGYDYTNYEFAKKGVAGNETNSTSTTIAKVQAANGAEIVTDYYGRQVDAFGTLITNASDKTSYSGEGTTGMNGKELLFVSTGYKDTYVGKYATLWAVYKQDSTKGNFTLLGYISSSMLYLNSFDNVSKYSDGTNTAAGRMSWTQFKNTYNTLKANYQGVPVLISYDKEIWNDSKDKAFRSDGKWFYSTGNEKIEANVKIQYVNDATAPAIDSAAWKDDAYDSTKTGTGGEKNIGTTTGCSAYFTNTSPEYYLLGKTESGKIFVDNDEYFTFEAKSAGMWEFVGWVRYSGGHYYEISSTNGIGQSNISSNDTYIARFKQASKGTLVVSHNIEKNSQYKGDGTKYLKVRVLNGTTPVFTEENTDGSDINVSKFINSKNSAYTIEITATTVGDEDCTPVERLADPSYYALTGNVSGNTLTQTKEFTVADVLEGDKATSAIRYITHLTKTNYNYSYEIQYNYTSRLWGDQSYTVTGNIDELQADKYFSGAKSSARLLDSFIKSSTPYEKNFRQTINWNYSNATKGATVNGTDVKLTATVNSTNTVNDKVTAEFILPYKYNEDTVENGEVTKYGDKKGVKLDVYDGDNKVGEDYAYDDKSYTSFTLTSKTGSLFEYDNPATPNAVTASSTTDDFKLVEAAPYVIKNPEFTYSKSSTKRYYTGNSFKVNNTTYYLREKPEGAEGTVITDAEVADGKYTVTIRKPGKTTDTTYRYAVQDETTNEVYFFAYALGTVNGVEDTPVDNEGNEVTNPKDYVFNGQYIVYSETQNISGIEQNNNYDKKYFTRWDIYTTSGKYVTSSFYQRFNYSGYEDYIVYPIYESDSVSASPATFDGESKDADIATSVGLLDTSRNQWNNSGKGTYPGADGSTDADKIFADFALSFYNKGEQISTSDENVKIGMVIEILGKVEKADGSAVDGLKEDAVTDSSYYATKYNTTGATFAYDADKVKQYATYKATNTGSSTKLPCKGSWFLPISNIDNFNRLQYTYTFTQGTNGGTLKTQGQYVYRATSYICVKENGTWTTKISSPEYFVLYDIASR